VLLVLREQAPRSRRDLIADTRSLLGFARTGSKLEEAIGQAIDALLHDGVVGEGSGGPGLRG
jgi:hypothetical protein